MKNYSLLILVFLSFVLSCSKPVVPNPDKDPQNPGEQIIVSKNITTGSFTEVSNSTVGLSGLTVNIAKPGTPVDGIEIAIPANAFTTNPALKISYAEIKSHQFGANFNPISPIISISCEGGYSNELMSLTIPVKIPAGHIPLGFYLDEITGKLEGIPFSSITSNSITLLTRHFLPSSKLKSGDINLKSAVSTGANIVISSIAENALNLPPMITSGFKPGVDDWEFVNDGSYIATGGHCAGQNMAAMWYYFEKKTSEGSLFNKFSDTPNLWEDNARGYRFCSVIHRDLDWEGNVTNMFRKYIDKNQELDRLKFLTIAGTMLVTGEPQGIGIYKDNGVKADGTPKYAGHDLICYKVSVSGGKLYISDPNTPGTEQSISFTNNKFTPYVAKLNGNAPATPFPYVTYYAKTAYIEWDKIGARYAQLLDNTIGTIAPNTFPAYTIWVKDNINDFELKDGMTVTNDTLRTKVECPTAESSVTINGKKYISSEVYGNDGVIKSIQDVKGVTNWGLSIGLYVKLTPGLNKLGYSIVGWNSNARYDNSTEKIPLFIDFKWINVFYSKLEISPNPIFGAPDKEITITARSFGSAPKDVKYVWNFGDGTPDISVNNDSIVKYKFIKSGEFNVVLKLYNNLNNELRATVTAKAIIKPVIVKLEISPNPIIGAPGKEITITAKTFGTAPKNAKYVWHFGDGTGEVVVNNDSIVKYTYPGSGSYDVIINLYDNVTNKLEGTSTVKANINGAIVKFELYFGVACHTKLTDSNGSIFTGAYYDNSYTLSLREIPCVQNGNIINASWDGNYMGYYHKGTATFTISSGNTVSFTISDIYTNPGAYVQTWSATSKDIPFIKDFNGITSYLEYGDPESINVLQSANVKIDHTLSKGGLYESTGIFYDPKYDDPSWGGRNGLSIKFIY